MSLVERIQQDMITALKARDTEKTGVLRMLSSALKNEAIKIENQSYVLSDQEALSVLNRELKQRRDAAQQYKDAGRPELAEKEEKEIAIIEVYMPKGLSDEALQQLVDSTIAELGATTKTDMGKVMGAIKSKLANPADAAKAASLVNQKLS